MSCPILLNTNTGCPELAQLNCCNLDMEPTEPECPCPTVEISNWDEMPQGIEIGSMPLFCIVDDEGEIIGRSFNCKVVDEATGATTYVKKVSMLNGGDPIPFDEAIHNEAVCNPKDDCESDGESGLSSWAE